MALLERVATLLRANLNDLIDKAENPEVMLKQIILDMQNQLMQVKTKVAVALADQHVLEKKKKENEDLAAEWVRKAEMAVEKGESDEVARYALEKSIAYRSLGEGFAKQLEEQASQVESLKSAFKKLEQKLAEAQAKSELLIAQHRRARAMAQAGEIGLKMNDGSPDAAFDRMNGRVQHEEAVSEATAELMGDGIEERLRHLERQSEVDRLLAEVKARRKAS